MNELAFPRQLLLTFRDSRQKEGMEVLEYDHGGFVHFLSTFRLLSIPYSALFEGYYSQYSQRIQIGITIRQQDKAKELNSR